MAKFVGGWMKREDYVCYGCGATSENFVLREHVWTPAMATDPPAPDVVLDAIVSCPQCETRAHMRWYDRGEFCLVRFEPFTAEDQA
jgi:hypothetical protein